MPYRMASVRRYFFTVIEFVTVRLRVVVWATRRNSPENRAPAPLGWRHDHDGEDHAAARGGPWWWTRWRSAVLDAGLAAGSAAECGAEGVRFARDAGVPVAVGVVFGVLAGSTLIVRRKWPIAVVLVSIAITPAQMGYVMGIVGLYTLAASELPRRIIGALAGMSFLGMLIVMFVRVRQDMQHGTWELGDWFLPFASITTAVGMTAPPVLLGMYVGARRRLMESLRERADSLERELQLLAERAEERAEWARGRSGLGSPVRCMTSSRIG